MSDLIKRSDAIKALYKYSFVSKDVIEKEINAVPSADRPQGEWIKRYGTINCSVCKRSNWSACFEDTVRSFNYCPNCGCRMKGADDDI